MIAMIEREKAREIIYGFRNQELLVVGDSMLDQWVWGKVNRISPEAPVPVVEVDYFSYSPGGAANVVNNICSLGSRSAIASIIGDDEFGTKLKDELCVRGVNISGLVIDPSRPTTTKTRIIAHNQQVVRTDLEKRNKINGEITEKMISYLSQNLDRFKMVIVSDYNKGVVTDKLIDFILEWKRKNKKQVIIGPKPENIKLYKDATFLTLNEKEAKSVSGENFTDIKGLEYAGLKILEECKNEAVLITRGEKGMSLFTDIGEIMHIPAIASEVYDVSGAGDTVLSVIALALSSGASLRDAVILSNFAAAIVVKKIGTATLSVSELVDLIDKQHVTINS